MSLSLFLGSIWVLCATVTAFLPMRRQYVPGVALLLLAPVIMIFIGYQHGPWWAVAGLAAFVSMMRNPLRYIWRKYVMGADLELPK